jgi:CsoR family transcriptional regulator, copper-sensing transcriptional repressor
MMAKTGAAPTVAACGCGVDHANTPHDRVAAGVDPNIKERNLKRLRRIEGQVRGIQKMVDADRYCSDIVTQVSAVHEALRSVSRELMRNHLKYCATRAIRGKPHEADAMYDELIDIMFTHSR